MALALGMRMMAFALLGLATLALGASCGHGAENRAAPRGLPSFADPLPGADVPSAELVRHLEARWAARDTASRPRTRHLNPDGTPKYTNRLFLESSPYLRQHAHNPVNWFPWGDEAFARARSLHRPVLLSVGYSTCHWCHVMEEESFEDDSIAAFMNRNFVAIKVDREERPDIDAVYMNAVQMMTGSGGWPLNVWLTPDRRPFFGGTYFPAHDGDRGARMGFITVLERLRQAYDQHPDEVTESALQITQRLQNALAGATGSDSLPSAAVLDSAFHAYESRYDDVSGGLLGERKFPGDLPVRFMLHYYYRTGDVKALEMAQFTLEKMASGGIHDQVGGGFHRYSTDRDWLVPHFEKMLYDNALLAIAYLEGWQVTSDSSFARVARGILRDVQRDMTSPDGAFYSASDADSPAPDGHREEGRFFTWTPSEMESVLGRHRAPTVERYFGVTAGGNFEGRNILSVGETDERAARALGVSPAAMRILLNESGEALYAARVKRGPPLRDEKIIAGWNGLMILAHARAALVFGEPEYARRAERAADFVLTRMRDHGELLRSFKDGQAHHPGYLEDYAFMVAGLLELYEATGHPRWLAEAIALDGVLAQRFEDARNGGYFRTGADGERLLAREKPGIDGAEPSGNSVEALNLLRLAEFTGKDQYRARADRTLTAFARTLANSPTALDEMLLAVDFRLGTPRELVIVTRDSREQAGPLLAKLRTTYLPNRIIVVAVEGADLERQAALVPLLEGKVSRNGQPTAYVCKQGTCDLPTREPETFAQQLARLQPTAGVKEARRPVPARRRE